MTANYTHHCTCGYATSSSQGLANHKRKHDKQGVLTMNKSEKVDRLGQTFNTITGQWEDNNNLGHD